ncbi:MAG: hypothetical protein IT168_21820 [Bryobacterales bacterium]|nr:hypothetical protein [Bryobacterales bacterium]
MRRGYAEILYAWPSRDRLERATAIDPGNAFHHVALGHWQEEAGQDPRPAYRAAVERLPADALLWVRLGLAEEIAGNIPEAERCLLEAGRRSRKYDVRWALANFYYRRQRPAEFITWAKASMEMAYTDLRPLFDLASSLLGDGARVRHEVLPERRPVWLQYALWAASNRNWDEAAAAAEKLGPPAEPSDRPPLAGLANVLIENRRFDEGFRVWRRLGSRDVPRMEWTPLAGRGVSVVVLEPGKRWRVDLNGDQAERCAVLTRLLPPASGALRELRWKAGGQNPGFLWEAATAGKGQVVARASWADGYLQVLSPEAVTVTLLYERPPGRMRFEGSLAVEALAVRESR